MNRAAILIGLVLLSAAVFVVAPLIGMKDTPVQALWGDRKSVV